MRHSRRIEVSVRRPRLGRAVLMACVAALCGAAAPAAAPKPPTRRLERAAAEVARAQVKKPDRFKVVSVSVQDGDVGDGATFETVDATTPDASGVVRVRFRALVAGVERGEVLVAVRGRVYGPAVVARRALLRGVPIDSTAVQVSHADLTGLGAAPLRRAEDAFGLSPLRNVGRDRVLTPLLLARPPASTGRSAGAPAAAVTHSGS